MDRITQAARMVFWILAAAGTGFQLYKSIREEAAAVLEETATDDQPTNALAEELGRHVKKIQDDIRAAYAKQATDRAATEQAAH